VRALAIDVGTTSVRAGVVELDGTVHHVHQRRFSVTSPNPGEVELDANEIWRFALEVAEQTLAAAGAVDVVGITNQRATTIVFDEWTGQPVGPALGWQDLRTVIDCLVLQGAGLRLAPNQSATKAQWLVTHAPEGATNLRFATIETWLAWHLTRGEVFVSDHSNAAVTGLVTIGATTWDAAVLAQVGLSSDMMPRIVDTTGAVGAASVLPGAPPITALVGDQSASLFGQGRVVSGAKITFGTGAMLDLVTGPAGPSEMTRFPSGVFPSVAYSRAGQLTWAIEAIDLAAGSCIEWLIDLGLITNASESEALATSVASSEGVFFVPALSGLGTPEWDFGARAGFFGLTRSATRAHLVRAVLEGIAHRGADLIAAAQSHTGEILSEIRIDGGMSANGFFVQCLADYAGVNVIVSSEREATTRGAGLMALVGAGALTLEQVAQLDTSASVVSPQLDAAQRITLREIWATMIGRAARTIPDLSNVTF
jgi:glycerol kinase